MIDSLNKQLQAESPTPQTCRDLAISQFRLGVLAGKLQQSDQAIAYLEASLQIMEALLVECPLPSYQQEVGGVKLMLAMKELEKVLEKRQEKSRTGGPGWWERVGQWIKTKFLGGD